MVKDEWKRSSTGVFGIMCLKLITGRRGWANEDYPRGIPQRALDIQEQFGEDRVELIKVIRDVDTQGVIFSDDEEE